MSLDDMPQVQAPQVQNAPEPVANMPKVDIAQFQKMDDLINGILDELGSKAAALTVAAGAKAVDMAASGVDRISNAAAAPFDPGHSLKGTPGISRSEEGPAQGRGRGVDEVQPTMGKSEERGLRAEQRVITEGVHVDNSMSAQLETPNVPNLNAAQGISRNDGFGR